MISDEGSATVKIARFWNEVNLIVWKGKNWKNIQKRVEPQLDKLFQIIHCQCPISCVEVVDCSLPSCSHMKIMSCEINCSLDNCPHKQIRSCVKEITCSLDSCSHLKTNCCMCLKEKKLPRLDFSFIRAQRLKVGEKCCYQIGFVDKRETKKQQQTLNRKEEDHIMDENRNKKIN